MLPSSDIARELRDTLMHMNTAMEARQVALAPTAELARTVPFGDGCYVLDEHNSGEFASQNTNRVEHLGVDGQASEVLVDQLIERYAKSGVPRFFVYVSPSSQAKELATWLVARGLEKGEYGLSVLHRAALDPPEPKTDFAVRLASAKDAELVLAALSAGSAQPEHPWAKGTTNMLGAPGFHTFLALDGSNAVATGSLYVAGSVGYLHRGATREAARKRGAQTALIAARAKFARDLGCQWLASETYSFLSSYGNLARSGFAEAYTRDIFTWQRPTET